MERASSRIIATAGGKSIWSEGERRKMLRVVLDTSVLVAAFRSQRGASNQILHWVGTRRFDIVVTPALFLEWEQVLKREEQRSVHMLSVTDLDAFLLDFLGYLEPARIYYRWRPQLLDRNDEMVLEAALNGRADMIVTHNTNDFELIRGLFAVDVVTPAQFLNEVLR